MVQHLHAVGLYRRLVNVLHVYVVPRPLLHLMIEVAICFVLAVVLILRSRHLLLLVSGVVFLVVCNILVHSVAVRPTGHWRSRRHRFVVHIALSCRTEVLVSLLGARELVLRGLLILIRNSHGLVEVLLEVGVNARANGLLDDESAPVGGVVLPDGRRIHLHPSSS